MSEFLENMHPFDDDKLHEECGVFGIFGHPDAAAHTALGLHALQHRGQEAAGIVSCDGDHFYSHRALGLVGDNFNSAEIINKLKGHIAIGHNRYSTTGDTLLRNVQPLFGDFSFGGMAVSHNGNLTNALTLRKQLIDIGCLFQSTSDTETIVHLVALSKQTTLEDRLFDALTRIEGAYSLVVLANDTLIGVRDPLGVRPLVMGKLGDAIILASESCALDIVGAEYVRDVEPGEIVIITKDGIRSLKPFPKTNRRFCIFEYVYFSRPDSISEGLNVYETRQRIGAELAREAPVDADVVVPVPDSGIPAALGFAKESRIPFELGIIRNHYVGRTFIEPSDHVRHLGVKLKHNGNRAVLEGKRVVLVDDSIVRGTTSKKIVNMVREAGASEVHMRIASPPTTHSCFYGVDTPTRDQLLAAKHSVLSMTNLIGADSLAFVSINGLYRAVSGASRNSFHPQFCDACFSGDYPIPLTDHDGANERQKDLFRIFGSVTGQLTNRIALITGASRGIGAAVAKRFAAESAQVILVARDSKGLEETDDAIRTAGGQATLVALDLTEFSKIDMLAQQVAARFGKLDILVGNAGILGELSPMQDQPEDSWQDVLNTNLTANWHLVRNFDPLLKASDAPRALFVTSDVAAMPMAYWGAYAVSKAALEMMVEIYAAENAKGVLKANLIDPGEVRTRMNAQAFPGLDPMTRVAPETITDIFVKLALPDLRETGKKFHVR